MSSLFRTLSIQQETEPKHEKIVIARTMIRTLQFFLIMTSALIVFSGCTKQTMPPEDTAKMTTRTYPNVSTDTILRAASELFFLADDIAFERIQTPDHFIAIRNHSLDIGLTFVQATDTWKVKVKNTTKGTRVTLDATSEETWLTGKTNVQKPQGPAMYLQFWNRLDYLLGRSKTWMSCQNLNDEYLEDRTWGDTWWLCSEVTDRIPPELIEGTWKKAGRFALSVEDENVCSKKVSDGEYGIPQTERQREVYKSTCLQELGYEKLKEPSDTQP